MPERDATTVSLSARTDARTNALPVLRPIVASDDAQMAAVIRTVMPEFGATGCGFAINDPEVDWMSRAYAAPRCAYFVLDLKGRIVGGGGVGPLQGGDADTCELRKMYFLRETRGLGMGNPMMERCLQAARDFGFARCYLETLTGMDAAMHLYQRNGFVRIDGPMGPPATAVATRSSCAICEASATTLCSMRPPLPQVAMTAGRGLPYAKIAAFRRREISACSLPISVP